MADERWEIDESPRKNSNNNSNNISSENTCWSVFKKCVSIGTKAVALYKRILAVVLFLIAPAFLFLSLIIFGLIRLVSDTSYRWLSSFSIAYGILLIICMFNSFYLFILLIKNNLEHDSSIISASKWEKYRINLKDKIWIAYSHYFLVTAIIFMSLASFILSINYSENYDISKGDMFSIKFFTNSKIGFSCSLFISGCFFLVIPLLWLKGNTLALNNFKQPEKVPSQMGTIIFWFIIFGGLSIGCCITVLYFIISTFDECSSRHWLQYYSIFLILLIFVSFIQWSFLLYILKRNFFLAKRTLWTEIELKQKITHGCFHVILFILVIICGCIASVLAFLPLGDCDDETLGFDVSLACTGVLIAVLWFSALLREGLTENQRTILAAVLGCFKSVVKCGHCIESHV